MSVGSGTPYNQHTGNGVTTSFAYGFTVLDDGDLVATVDGVTTSVTVNNVGNAAGGTVDFSTAPASGADVILRRVLTLTRLVEYQNNGDLLAATLNADLDRLLMLIQGTDDDSSRAIRAPFPETMDDLPAAADRADMLLSWDSDGNPIAVAPADGSAASLAVALASTSSAAQGDYLIGVKSTLTGGTARTQHAKNADVVSVKDFGAVGDGATNDTGAINAALAALSAGGALYFPAGTYLYRRGNGSLLSDNIPASNVTIYGDGAASIISSTNAAGSTPDDVGNEYYNVFQATSKSGITIRDISFSGYCAPLSCFSCTDVLVSGIRDNGQLSNAGTYMRDKAVYLYKCASVRVSDSYFLNDFFGVYLSGDITTPSSGVTITGNNFEHTTAAGSYAATFPVGVYAYFADDWTVTGNTFKNIYSSVNNGTTATGMGFGVYEGDGTCGNGVIADNVFRWAAKGTKRAIGTYTSNSRSVVISGNTFECEASSYVVDCILMDSKTQNTSYTVTGNIGRITSAVTDLNFIRAEAGTGAATAPKFTITGNVCNGASSAFKTYGLGSGSYLLSGNIFSGQLAAGVHFQADATTRPHRDITLTGNTITGSGTNGIRFDYYVISPRLIGNTIIDGNTTGQTVANGSAVFFVDKCQGCFAVDNFIGNTAYGGGGFSYGICNNDPNPYDRIYKDILLNNSFSGIADDAQMVSYWTSTPTGQIYDVSKGDFFKNSKLDSGEMEGWWCVMAKSYAITANASSASTTITVGSTTGLAAGDIVLLCKTSNLSDGSYATITNWHLDTIASITDATHFVLTTGIPAGDGTYSLSTAIVKIARFKGGAAIA